MEYVSYEIERCREYPDGIEVVTHDGHQPGDFWTVYGRLPCGEVRAIADFNSLDQAREAMAQLQGQ